MFQRGMEALQRHACSEAATAFDAVIMGFRERGLLDRARVYLELCARESARGRPPQDHRRETDSRNRRLNNDDDAAAEDLARVFLAMTPNTTWRCTSCRGLRAQRLTADALDFLGRAIALSPEDVHSSPHGRRLHRCTTRTPSDANRAADSSCWNAAPTRARIGLMGGTSRRNSRGRQGHANEVVPPESAHALAGRSLIEHVLRTVDGLRADP